MGDFNYPEIDWNYTISRAAEIHPSHIFLHSIQDSLLYQHVTQPTRHRLGESPNTLDLIITNEEGMINKNQPPPSYLQQRPHLFERVHLGVHRGTHGTSTKAKPLQRKLWENQRRLQGQPFTDAYRVFCNILTEKPEQHIPITTKH